MDAINAHIKSLKKEVADLEARRERFLFGVIGPSRFRDQTLILDLWLDFYPLYSLISFPHVYFPHLSLYSVHFIIIIFF